MKKICCMILALSVFLCFAGGAYAEDWTCRQCGTENHAKYCSECGYAGRVEWACGNCGTTNTGNFCIECGARKSVHTGDASGSPAVESAGFETAEEAARAYISYMNEGNLNGMLSCFALDTFIDHLSQEKYLERMPALTPNGYYSTPVSNEYSRSLLTARYYSDIIQSLYRQYLYHSTIDSEYADVPTKTIAIKDADQRSRYLSYMKNSPVAAWQSNIVLAEFLDVNVLTRGKYTNELNQTNIQRNKEQYGCSDLADLAVLLEINGKQYIQFMECGQYDGCWYILSLQGTAASLMGIAPVQGGLVSVAELS